MDTMTDSVSVTGVQPMLDEAPAGGPGDFSLHADTDEICPRCLRWICPEDFLRRNAWGLLQHESCPPMHLSSVAYAGL